MIRPPYRPLRGLRLNLAVSTGEYERHDYPVQVEINWTQVLSSVGQIQPFDDGYVHLVETDAAGGIVGPDLPFQFDRDPAFDAQDYAKGTALFVLQGVTPARATRYYALLVEENAVGRVPGSMRVSMAQDEGQECFQIETPNGTYLYQIRAAGLSSLLDRDGNDWVGFHPWGGSDGKYRGLPNLGVIEGGFHPGFLNCQSAIIYHGPIHVQVHSETNDQLWAGRWDFYPAFARFTVLKVASSYWFLYEGTPGGKLDLKGGYIVRSDGRRTPMMERWDEALPRPRWLYFGSGATERVIYFVHHPDDNQDVMDSFWPMEGNMTVFGFGRQNLNHYLTRTPGVFTVGLCESGDYGRASRVINSAIHGIEVVISQPELL